MEQFTQEQIEQIVSHIMKTSADKVIEHEQSATNIELAHRFLENADNTNFNTTESISKANVYANLAIADQLVILNRTLGSLGTLLVENSRKVLAPGTSGIVRGF